MKEKLIKALLKWLGIDERAIQHLEKKGREYVVADKKRAVIVDYIDKLEREAEEIKQQQAQPGYWDAVERGRSGGQVYFILNESAGMVKIGFSRNPEKRLTELRTGSAGEIKLLATIEGSLAIERQLHKRFEMHRRNGEWFIYSDEIRSYINALKPQS